MIDFFGRAAAARTKALEEALEIERGRVKDLTLQLIAMADTKAHRALVPLPATVVRREAGHFTPKPGVGRPGEHRNHNASVHAAREVARGQE